MAKYVVVHLVSFAIFLLVANGQSSPASSTLLWRLRVLYSQRLLTGNVPMDKLAMCGSRRSANHFDALPLKTQQIERQLLRSPQTPAVASNGYTVSGQLALASQCYSVTTQLQLGVRHLHVELHHIFGTGLRVCHRRVDFCGNVTRATGNAQACDQIFGFPNMGDSTGCHQVSACHDGICL